MGMRARVLDDVAGPDFGPTADTPSGSACSSGIGANAYDALILVLSCTGTIFNNSFKGASHVSQTVLTEQASGCGSGARAGRLQRRPGRRQQHEPLRRRLVQLLQSAGVPQRGCKPYLAAEPPERADGA